jgi:hypothetical protein
MAVNLRIETEQEDDGRWITEIPDLPGVMIYGTSRDEAVSRVKAAGWHRRGVNSVPLALPVLHRIQAETHRRHWRSQWHTRVASGVGSVRRRYALSQAVRDAVQAYNL